MRPIWTKQELDVIGTTEEIEIAPRNRDGSLRDYATTWVVRVNDELLVRSARGDEGGWFRHAVKSGLGRVLVRGFAYNITFEKPRGVESREVDRAYRAKYSKSSLISFLVSAEAAAATLRIDPADEASMRSTLT